MNRNKLKAASALAFALLAGSAVGFAALGGPKTLPSAPTKPVELPPADDARSQYELARAVTAARSAPGARQTRMLQETRRDYRGRRYSWEAAYVPALCQRRDRCFVAPFDHARPDAPTHQGWMIELDVSAETHRELMRACAAHRTPCVIRIGGRLTKLVLQSELPTAVGLSDVELRGARAARPNESWIRRPR